ncbi:MAG: hypothetical protein P4L99_14385, partial [Chthoniobacter sp.]|nr:hypothetical protein [Chthoniobacter sp.]
AAQRTKMISMPFLEMLALVTAAATWGHKWSGRKIRFRSDCKAVVDAISGRPSRKEGTAHLLRELCLLAARHQFDFRCEHIPGAENIHADVLSRYGDCPLFRSQAPAAAAQPSPIISVRLQ